MRALMRFCMRAARISLHLGVAYTVLYTTATSYLLSQIPDDQVSHLPVPVQRLIEFSMPVPAPFGETVYRLFNTVYNSTWLEDTATWLNHTSSILRSHRPLHCTVAPAATYAWDPRRIRCVRQIPGANSADDVLGSDPPPPPPRIHDCGIDDPHWTPIYTWGSYQKRTCQPTYELWNPETYQHPYLPTSEPCSNQDPTFTVSASWGYDTQLAGCSKEFSTNQIDHEYKFDDLVYGLFRDDPRNRHLDLNTAFEPCDKHSLRTIIVRDGKIKRQCQAARLPVGDSAPTEDLMHSFEDLSVPQPSLSSVAVLQVGHVGDATASPTPTPAELPSGVSSAFTATVKQRPRLPDVRNAVWIPSWLAFLFINMIIGTLLVDYWPRYWRQVKNLPSRTYEGVLSCFAGYGSAVIRLGKVIGRFAALARYSVIPLPILVLRIIVVPLAICGKMFVQTFTRLHALVSRLGAIILYTVIQSFVNVAVYLQNTTAGMIELLDFLLLGPCLAWVAANLIAILNWTSEQICGLVLRLIADISTDTRSLNADSEVPFHDLPPVYPTAEDLTRFGSTPRHCTSSQSTRSRATKSQHRGSITGDAPRINDVASVGSLGSTKNSSWFKRIKLRARPGEVVGDVNGPCHASSSETESLSGASFKSLNSLKSLVCTKSSKSVSQLSASSPSSRANADRTRTASPSQEGSASDSGKPSSTSEKSNGDSSFNTAAIHPENRFRVHGGTSTPLPGYGRHRRLHVLNYPRRRFVEIPVPEPVQDSGRPEHQPIKRGSFQAGTETTASFVEASATNAEEDMVDVTGKGSLHSVSGSSSSSSNGIEKSKSLTDMDIETPPQGNSAVVSDRGVSSASEDNDSDFESRLLSRENTDSEPSFGNQPWHSTLSGSIGRSLNAFTSKFFPSPSRSERCSANRRDRPVEPLSDVLANPFLDSADRAGVTAGVELGRASGENNAVPLVLNVSDPLRRRLKGLPGVPMQSAITPVEMSGNVREGASPFEVAPVHRGPLAYGQARSRPAKGKGVRRSLPRAFDTPDLPQRLRVASVVRNAVPRVDASAFTSLVDNTVSIGRTASFASGCFGPSEAPASPAVTVVSPARDGQPVVWEADVPSAAAAAEDDRHVGNDSIGEGGLPLEDLMLG